MLTDSAPPDELAQLQTYPRRAIRLGLLAILVFFGGFLGWAGWAPLNGAVIVQGTVEAREPALPVAAPVRGTLARLLVQDGQKVQAGALLLVLDAEETRAALRMHESQIFDALAVASRAGAELAGQTTLIFPPQLPQNDPVARAAMVRERLLFEAWAQLRAAQARLAPETYWPLAMAAQARAAAELREAQQNLAARLPLLAADQALLAASNIRAPVAGSVSGLRVRAEEMVEAGQPLLRIVPAQRRLFARALVSPDEVAQLRPGQAASLIPRGFNPREAPSLSGLVSSIDAERSLEARTGESAYGVEIALASSPAVEQLRPGMRLDVIVPEGGRSLLDYLVSPLVNTLRQAGREK